MKFQLYTGVIALILVAQLAVRLWQSDIKQFPTSAWCSCGH